MRLSRHVTRVLLALLGILAIIAATVACGSDGAPASSSGNASSTPTAAKSNALPAPTFSGETLDGGTFDLASYAGTPVVINFWFPSCPPCRAEMPDMQAAHEKYGDRVQFVGIQQLGLDTEADGRAFLQDLGVTYPTIPDKGLKIQSAYSILNYPTTIFLDSDHNIVRSWTGLIRPADLDKQIESILNS